MAGMNPVNVWVQQLKAVPISPDASVSINAFLDFLERNLNMARLALITPSPHYFKFNRTYLQQAMDLPTILVSEVIGGKFFAHWFGTAIMKSQMLSLPNNAIGPGPLNTWANGSIMYKSGDIRPLAKSLFANVQILPDNIDLTLKMFCEAIITLMRSTYWRAAGWSYPSGIIPPRWLDVTRNAY